MSPQALNIVGSTQPEVFRQTVEDMTRDLRADAAYFWPETVATDGPVEVWVINGEAFLFNGNHRYHAALAAGVEIPDEYVDIRDKTGSPILTFRLGDQVWL